MRFEQASRLRQQPVADKDGVAVRRRVYGQCFHCCSLKFEPPARRAGCGLVFGERRICRFIGISV
ncbi:hypothetical protein EPM78_07375 [Neisseria gonorrhoeae]|uniref:Uncharacterized protein n=1 Tax=Neisseria gonorrhoeae TaxID=485 RepID=A0AAX2TRD7_NEIGO|nr:hypothetical protein A6J43_10405 [Neisseria gonorrhoeae]ARC02275.1 hypothetical protein A6J44_05010 [Neisseria gonorrhoeae]ARC04350.1 hypothetical protein A6J46_12340 [Neisseria gonorrhoeae]ASQ72457.1 hypothetical protein BZG33_00585 [Neisseria gonorrhoeae]ASQ74775.1 hypothetical protein BZG34_00585 [Neisseria gonorrhoeae]